MQKIKTIQDTLTRTTEIILPNDANTIGNLMGGKLMYWMDIAAAIAAQKHCNSTVVTASVDNISFSNPVKIGNVLTIETRVTQAFNTSMEVFIRVWDEDLLSQEKYLSNEAYFTFVALGSNGRPKKVDPIIAETEEEKEMQAGALRRRQLRLILGGKMKAQDASELKALFMD